MKREFNLNGTISVLDMTPEEYCMHFPSDGKVANEVETVLPTTSDLEIEVTNLLTQIGMPRHIRGFKFIRRALMLSINDQSYIEQVTKKLYPTLAYDFETTPSRVERAMRHSIEVTWNRGNTHKLDKLFGWSLSPDKGKPANSEFIALLADTLRLKLKDASNA